MNPTNREVIARFNARHRAREAQPAPPALRDGPRGPEFAPGDNLCRADLPWIEHEDAAVERRRTQRVERLVVGIGLLIFVASVIGGITAAMGGAR